MGQVEDLAPYRTAVNEAAARVRGLWLGYIALLAYLFIAVGAVTHRDLLLENPVKLPVLNVELPLIGFFAVAPLFFLINHFYLLLQLKGLSQRIREFNDEIGNFAHFRKERHRERRRLDTFVIVQMLGGTGEEREQWTGRFLKLIALITLVIAPVALLLIIQLQFLPYQYELVTNWHRLTLILDIGLLCVFWPAIMLGGWVQWQLPAGRTAAALLAWATTASAVVLFSCVIATFPGEWADGGSQSRNWTKPEDSFLPTSKSWLFGSLASGQTRRRLIPFSRALDLPDDKTLIDLGKFDKIRQRHRDNKDQLKPWETGRTLSLRERKLRGAMFDRSDLRNVDLSGANLQGALLRSTNLQGALLSFASLQGAWLDSGQLQGASLNDASLQGAWLGSAQLQGASLQNARLKGVSLIHASLQGAFLVSAQLQGASLHWARLQGASLQYARLQGASLSYAQLQGASLQYASLQGASLDNTDLQGASFESANVQGASFDNARLQGVSLVATGLQGVRLRSARLQGASLTTTFLWRTHGTPVIGNPIRVQVERPQLQPLSARQLAELEFRALAGVEDGETRHKIITALGRLSAPAKDIKDNLPNTYWTSIEGKLSEAEHQRHLVEILEKLACDENGAPYIAQGLVQFEFGIYALDARLVSVGATRLPDVARTLLDAAEGRTSGCPGVKGLDTGSIARLRKWAAGPEKEAK